MEKLEKSIESAMNRCRGFWAFKTWLPKTVHDPAAVKVSWQAQVEVVEGNLKIHFKRYCWALSITMWQKMCIDCIDVKRERNQDTLNSTQRIPTDFLGRSSPGADLLTRTMQENASVSRKTKDSQGFFVSLHHPHPEAWFGSPFSHNLKGVKR